MSILRSLPLRSWLLRSALRSGLWSWVWTPFCVLAAPAPTGCKVVDLMPAYWAALKQPDASQALHATVIDPHPDLYNATYVDLPSGTRWTEKLTRERAYAELHAKQIEAVEGYPPRAGYYVGMLISQRLAKTYSLRELAHLDREQVRKLVAAELGKLADG